MSVRPDVYKASGTYNQRALYYVERTRDISGDRFEKIWWVIYHNGHHAEWLILQSGPPSPQDYGRYLARVSWLEILVETGFSKGDVHCKTRSEVIP